MFVAVGEQAVLSWRATCAPGALEGSDPSTAQGWECAPVVSDITSLGWQQKVFKEEQLKSSHWLMAENSW